MQKGNCGLEFVLNSNVHIEVVSPQKVITQQVDIHNKATKKLVDGILKFIRGEFNQTYRRPKDVEISYPGEAKKYIPCYINIGTGGIRLRTETIDNVQYRVPDVDAAKPRVAPVEADWNSSDNYVRFTDLELALEAKMPATTNDTTENIVFDKSRYEIGVIGFDETSDSIPAIGDMEQIIFETDIVPGYYNSMYTSSAHPLDVFITEIGLFANSQPGTKDLLARVILKEDSILYVRPQDYILIKWTISLISLNDNSYTDEDINTTNLSLKGGSAVNDKIPYSGTITNSTRRNTSSRN